MEADSDRNSEKILGIIPINYPIIYTTSFSLAASGLSALCLMFYESFTTQTQVWTLKLLDIYRFIN